MTEATFTAAWFVLQVITWGLILDALLSRSLIDRQFDFQRALDAIRPARGGEVG